MRQTRKKNSFLPDEVSIDFLGGVTFYQYIRWREEISKEGKYGMLDGIKGKKSENKYLASQAYRSKLVREFWRSKCNVCIKTERSNWKKRHTFGRQSLNKGDEIIQ